MLIRPSHSPSPSFNGSLLLSVSTASTAGALPASAAAVDWGRAAVPREALPITFLESQMSTSPHREGVRLSLCSQ